MAFSTLGLVEETDIITLIHDWAQTVDSAHKETVYDHFDSVQCALVAQSTYYQMYIKATFLNVLEYTFI